MIHKVLGSYRHVKEHKFRVDGGLQQKTSTAEATGRSACQGHGYTISTIVSVNQYCHQQFCK